MIPRSLIIAFLIITTGPLACWALQITEIMYHPQTAENLYEFVEVYNETIAQRDLSGWRLSGAVDFNFPAGTILPAHSYLVIAANPDTLMNQYDLTGVLGPFTGRLANSTETLRLRDNANGIIDAVEYHDDGKWPAAADGTGHSLTKCRLRGASSDPDSWCASAVLGGTPGRGSAGEAWVEEQEIIAVGATWRYFEGRQEASSPLSAWRQVGFSDRAWKSGATGIGFSDNDDRTVLTNMSGNYWSIFCRKTFTLSDPGSFEQLTLEIDHDDGFVAYLNGTEVARHSMPSGTIRYNTAALNHEASSGNSNPQAVTVVDLTARIHLLQSGENVLAVQVHNQSLTSSDLSFIPRLVGRRLHSAATASASALINEVHFQIPGEQFIELYNPTNLDLDLSGYCLSNDADDLVCYTLPAGTLLPAGGFQSFSVAELGFPLNPTGDKVLFSAPEGNVVLDARVVEPNPTALVECRYPDGSNTWVYGNPTPDAANMADLQSAVVINEIMYHPPSDDVAEEYIELYNRGTKTVDLTGWHFTRGISYAFPEGTRLATSDYLIIAKDRDLLIARHDLDPSRVLGNFNGQLNDSGEKIRLRDAQRNVADEVHYYEGGHWPKYADGYGSSLELIDPHQDNNHYQNWAASDESHQAQWQRYAYSAKVQVPSDRNEHEFHFHLMGPGEVLIDDIHVRRGSTDYFSNGGFESGDGSWKFLGNHTQSLVISNDKHSGDRCLRIVSTGRGDTGVNHIEQDAYRTMTNNATYTIEFWAKWQAGNRVLLTRCWDNQAPETHMLPIPEITGTPGGRNSARQNNLGPVYAQPRHTPAVPRPSDPVQFTVNVSDPDGVTQVLLYYKTDKDNSYRSLTMVDDGKHGDGSARDGRYGVTLPKQSDQQTVSFYVQGTDGQGAKSTWPSDTTRPALYRVENNTHLATMPVYRIVLSQQSRNDMNQQSWLSNEPVNCTFVFNETDVYYNCGFRYTGSPWYRGSKNPSGVKVRFNADEKLHGVKHVARADRNIGGAYHDRLSYDMQRWMGLPHCQLEYVTILINSDSPQVMEDTLAPGRRYLDIYYPKDNDGPLFEIDDRFRYRVNDDTMKNALNWSNDFERFNATFAWRGNDKDSYRHNIEIRNQDNQDDYTQVMAMLDTLNHASTSVYQREVAKVINVDQWFKLFAVRACIADWDFLAFGRGKNCYIYWPAERGQFDMFGWDSEKTFKNSSNRINLSIWSEFPVIKKLQQTGGHRHTYYTYLKEMLDKYFTRSKLDPLINHYASLVGGDPSSDKSFINSRRTYLLNLLKNYTIGKISMRITTGGGSSATVAGDSVTLAGTAPIEVRWVRVNGRDHWLDWTGTTNWKVTLPVVGKPNSLRLEYLDYDKKVVGSSTVNLKYN